MTVERLNRMMLYDSKGRDDRQRHINEDIFIRIDLRLPLDYSPGGANTENSSNERHSSDGAVLLLESISFQLTSLTAKAISSSRLKRGE